MDMQEKDLNELISDNYDFIFSYCRRRVDSVDAAYDITQTVFLAFIERFPSISENAYRQWLINTSLNKISDYFRGKSKERSNRSYEELDDEKMGLIDDPFEIFSEEEFEKHLNTVLQELSPDEIALCEEIRKYNKHETEYSDMASKNSISEAAMRKRVSRLKMKVEKIISTLLYIFSIK